MAKRAAMLLVLFMALAAASEAHGHHRAADPHAPTHLHFYFHDTSTGPNPSARKLTDPLDPTAQTMFGLVMVMDDPLTEGPKPRSAAVGRAQGLYMGTDQSGGLCLLQVMNLVLNSGPYNGSSQTVLGRNCMLDAVREMPIIGGTGAFRFARGYAEARTNLFDLKSRDAIIEYNDKTREEIQNKENETQGPISSEQRSNIFQTSYKGTLKCKSSQPRGYGYMAKPPSVSERFRSQLEDQARSHAETQKVNSVLTHRVTELQDQLQVERESTQERINLERAERENLEERLKEEHAEREKLLEEERAERDRLLEAERRSRLEFEKNMMAKFTQLSNQMGIKQTQANQTPKKMTGKENSNPNLQNTLLKNTNTTGALGTRRNIISPNALIQAATKQNRQFRAMDSNV